MRLRVAIAEVGSPVDASNMPLAAVADQPGFIVPVFGPRQQLLVFAAGVTPKLKTGDHFSVLAITHRKRLTLRLVRRGPSFAPGRKSARP